MKIIYASLLSFSILLLTFSKSMIALQYEINKKFIAATLCENRNNPMSHCNGSCHLKKTMNNDEQKENSPGSTAKSTVEIELFSMPSENMIYSEGIIQSSAAFILQQLPLNLTFPFFIRLKLLNAVGIIELRPASLRDELIIQ